MRATARVLILLASFLTLGIRPVSAQTGVYGPVSVHVKAGDLVPDLRYTQILSAEGVLTTWSSVDFNGKFTVLGFFPDTSHNLQPVSRWNAMVDQFADKPVQFAWITGEKEATLLPWLKQHPIKGWVFYDPDGATGRAFGMERPASVIVGPDRNILGFAPIGAVDAQEITAALEGRITTVRPGPASMREFVTSGKALMDAEPLRFHGPAEYKPDLPPSYTVHISPSADLGEGTFSSDDFSSLRGYSLKRLVTEVYGVTLPRVAFPPALDISKLYDVALVLPEREDRQQMDRRIQQAIEEYFHFSATHEERLVDVYVVTSITGKPPAAEDNRGTGFGGISSGSLSLDRNLRNAGPAAEFGRTPAPFPLAQVRGISTEGTVDSFCSFLERTLDRPVVNETQLRGRYKFDVKASDGPTNDFLDRLRDEVHLAITPDQRRIDILVLNTR
jgi:uncharacterized protein (TIGR03435 family)